MDIAIKKIPKKPTRVSKVQSRKADRIPSLQEAFHIQRVLNNDCAFSISKEEQARKDFAVTLDFGKWKLLHKTIIANWRKRKNIIPSGLFRSNLLWNQLTPPKIVARELPQKLPNELVVEILKHAYDSNIIKELNNVYPYPQQITLTPQTIGHYCNTINKEDISLCSALTQDHAMYFKIEGSDVIIDKELSVIWGKYYKKNTAQVILFDTYLKNIKNTQPKSLPLDFYYAEPEKLITRVGL